MITLYVRTGCPYCAKVIQTGGELGLNVALKNVGDPGIAYELIARGGKKQEPYLIDSEKGVEMYESAQIDAYLRQTYGGERS